MIGYVIPESRLHAKIWPGFFAGAQQWGLHRSKKLQSSFCEQFSFCEGPGRRHARARLGITQPCPHSSAAGALTRQKLDIQLLKRSFVQCQGPGIVGHSLTWLQLMWLQLEVVRRPVGVVWGRFGAPLGPGPRTAVNFSHMSCSHIYRPP
jgi:hypothetical protein